MRCLNCNNETTSMGETGAFYICFECATKISPIECNSIRRIIRAACLRAKRRAKKNTPEAIAKRQQKYLEGRFGTKPPIDEIAISNKRQINLTKAFSYIQWNWDNCKCTIIGYGDKPQFKIAGTFTHENVDYPVIYKTFHPGGCYASLKIVLPNGKIKTIGRAGQKQAEEIKTKLIKKIDKYHTPRKSRK